jgi:hypothetical protein
LRADVAALKAIARAVGTDALAVDGVTLLDAFGRGEAISTVVCAGNTGLYGATEVVAAAHLVATRSTVPRAVLTAFAELADVVSTLNRAVAAVARTRGAVLTSQSTEAIPALKRTAELAWRARHGALWCPTVGGTCDAILGCIADPITAQQRTWATTVHWAGLAGLASLTGSVTAGRADVLAAVLRAALTVDGAVDATLSVRAESVAAVSAGADSAVRLAGLAVLL